MSVQRCTLKSAAKGTQPGQTFIRLEKKALKDISKEKSISIIYQREGKSQRQKRKER